MRPRPSWRGPSDSPRAAQDPAAKREGHELPRIAIAAAAARDAEASRWRTRLETVSASFAPPPQDCVLHFMGQQMAVAPLVPSLALGNEFTIEVWVYLETPVPWATIITRRDEPSNMDFGRGPAWS